MKIIKPGFRLSRAVFLLAPVAMLLSSLAALGLPSLVMANEVQGVNAAVVGSPSDAGTEDIIDEFAEEIISDEFSDDMLDFILSSDAEILQAIEHRPLLDMLDAGDTAGMDNKTGDRTDRVKQARAAGRHGG